MDEGSVSVSTIQPEVATRPTRATLTPRVAGVVLGLLTFAGYLPGLGRSLDFDSAETIGLFVRPGPPWSVFHQQAVFNNHPMFSFLEQLVRATTGRSGAATMRLLPVLCGATCVGVLAWFVAHRHGVVAGLAAGALLACNPTFAGLSRAARGYSLLTLCALVATLVVVEDPRTHPRRVDALYIVAAGAGLATHLYMVPVLAAHVGMLLARGRWDGRWRRRLLGVLLAGAVAYAGMAAAMVEAAGEHARVFKPAMPWHVASMATGGGWAALVVAPLVCAGALVVLRDSRAARGAAAGMAVVLLGLWAVMQSSALEERFFVWMVPGAAYLAGVAIARVRGSWVLAAGSAALALAVIVPGYTRDPTSYRLAAALVESTSASGSRACVVDVGVPPMRAYLDTPRDFATITEPAQLEGCDVVVVAAWWPTTAAWFASDRRVIDAAEARYPYRLVLGHADPALVLATRPLTR